METLSKEELLSILKKMSGEMECAICLTVLDPPLCFCQNGHCICVSCKQMLTICPTCRAEFLNIKTTPKIITNILGILPRECKYVLDGCTYLSRPTQITKSSVSNHEITCPFRSVPCALCSNWNGKANQLERHITQGCATYIIPSSRLDKLRLRGNGMFPIDLNTNQTVVYNLVAPDSIYWMYCRVDKDKHVMMTFFVYIPTSTNFKGEQFSDIGFNKRDSSFAIKYTQRVFTEDYDIETIFSSENCVAIPLSQVLSFTRNNNELFFRYVILRKMNFKM